ncbi:MAG: hypothetical protein H3C62_00965 [Gemmatimonadaceae bacterium]|nr:hypothetical protein [Gemmatimonadaceae bacterium]
MADRQKRVRRLTAAERVFLARLAAELPPSEPPPVIAALAASGRARRASAVIATALRADTTTASVRPLGGVLPVLPS